MSKIHILNSEKYGETLVTGWDVGGNCFFVLVDDDDENPSFWKPILDNVDAVEACFRELGEAFPSQIKEALLDHRMGGVEDNFMFDLQQQRFVTPADFADDDDDLDD